MGYDAKVPSIVATPTFNAWLRDLRDLRARARVVSRLDAMALGNPGDVASVGGGVHEMRMHVGPGYRIYFAFRGRDIVLLLAGGDKSTQRSDILRAKEILARWKDTDR
jgi:putative addiction module killer protein